MLYLAWSVTGRIPKIWGTGSFLTGLVARTLFFDSVIRNLGSEMKQLVILGAGFDGRAHRLTLPRNCKVFEVNDKHTQQCKLEILKNNQNCFENENISYVTANFGNSVQQEDFFSKLIENGFDPNTKALFLLEGVSRYLKWEELSHILNKVSSSSAAGSLVAMDISVDKWSTEDKRKTYAESLPLMQRMPRFGPPDEFGMDEFTDTPEKKFLPLGFDCVEIWLGHREIERRYLGTTKELQLGGNSLHLVVLRV